MASQSFRMLHGAMLYRLRRTGLGNAPTGLPVFGILSVGWRISALTALQLTPGTVH